MEELIEQKNFKFYAVAIKKEGRFYIATVEYYNPFTCYIIDEHHATLFKTIKMANRFKQEILKWKNENKFISDEFKDFSYVTVAEISELKWR